ncbi:AEC family transporter [Kaarinaea lacus]
MLDVLIQMAGLIVCGVAWRVLRPADLDPVVTRKVLTSLVYYLLLPALVLSVLWKAELGTSSVLITAAAAAGVLVSLLASVLFCRFCKTQAAEAGALLLAAAFPNATYLGLPVLEATFGPWARSVAVQYDLFACTPLLFTLGIWIAARYGSRVANAAKYKSLLTIPALWAAIIAVSLNGFEIAMPKLLEGFLTLLERGVAPLMLFSLGLSLEWKRSRWRLLPSLVPVISISLFIAPALVFALVTYFGMGGELRAAVVMEAAMPSMVIGLVICDRFNLDVSLYAAAVTVTTALSLVTLPLWYGWLM